MKHFLLLVLVLISIQVNALMKMPVKWMQIDRFNRFHAKSKALSLTPNFGLQYANKDYYNTNIQLLPGFEYFWMNNFSSGIILGPDFHMRQSGAEHHFHFGSTEELYARKYFPIGKKRFNKSIFTSLGINHSIRWNHYHQSSTNGHTKDIEAHLKPFIETGLAYVINTKFVLNAAIRANYRYDATYNGKSFTTKPDFEMGYNFTIKYFLN
ncbi:MAG: hypothetical protein RJA07_272 [Bacteroidota bacterium]|jgi:hypothetical protein